MPGMSAAEKSSKSTAGTPGTDKSDKANDKLIVAISSRALFNLDESHRVYEEQGVEAYRKYQIAHEDEPLAPGDAFHLVKKRYIRRFPQRLQHARRSRSLSLQRLL